MKPFLKWVGSKQKLLPQLHKLLPLDLYDRKYVEPFLGSGALFFSLAEALEAADCEVVLGDANRELFNVYRRLRDEKTRKRVLQLFKALQKKHSKAHYYATRTAFNGTLDVLGIRYRACDQTLRAAQFLYLNRTCFNGVYRLNRQGKFNVPVGDYDEPHYPSSAELTKAGELLEAVTLRWSDFDDTLENCCTKKSFVYLDPPYVPVSKTANFVGYTGNGFDLSDLERLRTACDLMTRLGAKWMMSNSDAPIVRETFRRYNIVEVTRSGSLNSDTSKRGKVRELVVRNY